MEIIPRTLSRQCLRLEPSSTGFAEMYRRDEAQRLEVPARSVLRDAASRDCVGVQGGCHLPQRVSQEGRKHGWWHSDTPPRKLRGFSPCLVIREVEAQSGSWYIRRILPYRSQDNGVEGVVITFADITERTHAADALETARREAQLSNIVKSRFLAAASHDLRQPLQALSLMRGALDRRIREDKKEEALELVARLDETARRCRAC